jgi:hypothetical protein
MQFKDISYDVKKASNIFKLNLGCAELTEGKKLVHVAGSVDGHRVRLFHGKTEHTPSEYFTDDLDDAKGTAEDMVRRATSVKEEVVVEAADFVPSITTTGVGAKQKQFHGARMVTGRGYGSHAQINTPASSTITKKYSFPELKGVFSPETPFADKAPVEVKGRSMVDDEDDASVAQTVDAPKSDDLAGRIHAQLHGATRAVIGLPHIKAALAKGMEANSIIGMSRSSTGRKYLRSLAETFTNSWMVNILKEGNIYQYQIMDGEDILAEGINMTANGAAKYAFDRIGELEEEIVEQTIIMLEEQEKEQGKVSRVLNIAKSVAK